MLDEVHQQRSCIARIDDFLGIEGFGRPERRADRIELLVKLRLQDFRVFSFGQFLSERRFDPARHGQAAPVATGPAITPLGPALVHHGRSGEAIGLPDDNGADRHIGLVDGGHGAHTGAGHARGLRLHTHGKAGAVNEVDNRQMELRAKVHVAGDLVADIRRPGTIQEEGVAGQNADWVPVDTGEAADNAPAPIMADLEEAACVDGRFHNLARLVGCLAIGRHDREKALLTAVRLVPWRLSFRQFVHGGWQIGEEAACRFEGIGFVVDHIVNCAVLPLDFPAAEFFLRDVFAKCNRDRRASNENLAEFFHHDREMAGGDAPGAHAGTRPEGE